MSISKWNWLYNFESLCF